MIDLRELFPRNVMSLGSPRNGFEKFQFVYALRKIFLRGH